MDRARKQAELARGAIGRARMSLDLDLSLDTLIAWKRKPHAMVEDLFGVKPDPWQREALEAFPHTPRMAMKACAGPGNGSWTNLEPIPIRSCRYARRSSPAIRKAHIVQAGNPTHLSGPLYAACTRARRFWRVIENYRRPRRSEAHDPRLV
jgi:hypothetical protein